ncbi:MAG: hypothetical protein JO180_03580 [Gemmatirosa sp.]|nr:hypothetical protein [Gemmatirosa sp.]
MMHRPLALAALLALAAAPMAAQTVRKDAPVPRRRAAPTTKPAAKPAAKPAVAPADATQPLADADLAFAKSAAGLGLRDAMLATFADDAVVFSPRATRARPVIATMPPSTGQTTWAPAWADVSAAGELGMTTGPIAFHTTAPDSTANGQYVTIWTRTGTAWKALIHLTIPGPAATQVAYQVHRAAADGRPRGGPGAADAGRATLYIADRALAFGDDYGASLARVALPDLHLLREGALPAVGIDSARATLAARDARLGGRVRWQSEDARVARSGDLGVTNGVYERRDAADAIIESGNYLRVWERQPDGGWRVLLDAATPLR